MPKKIDLTGEKYGKLTVLRQVKGNSKYKTWECQCDCGNIIRVDSRHLRSGATTSCGCSKEEKGGRHAGRKAADLTGRVYGRLTVLERAPNKNSLVMWKCRCSCGQITTASSHDLNIGLKKSCGCLRKESSRKLDITGNRYGKLVALYPTGKTEESGSMLWRCRCDCGNEVDVSVSSLNKGNNKSCGCLKKEYQKLVHDRLHLIDGTCIEWLDGRKSRSDNTSGFRGVFRKKSGKYSVSIGFKKKIYYIGTFEEYSDAVDARLRAEKMIHDGFVEAHDYWLQRAEQDPEWAEKNPFSFDVTKENGILVIHNSMAEFMEADREAPKEQVTDLFMTESDLNGQDSYSDGAARENSAGETASGDDSGTENQRALALMNIPAGPGPGR